MAHNEYIREVPGSDTVVLCIHGIFGSPDVFKPILKQIPTYWSVFNILLDGHGKSVQDFARSSMTKWKGQVQRTLTYLSVRYSKIIIVGHSMGTLFSIQRAIARPDKVAALFLLASPMKVKVKPTVVKYSLRIVFNKVDESLPIERTARDTLGIKTTRKMWKYIPWAPRFFELFSEIRKTRPLINKLSVPTYVFQSELDELVSPGSCQYFENLEGVELVRLHTSSHQCYSDEDKQYLFDRFSSLFL